MRHVVTALVFAALSVGHAQNLAEILNFEAKQSGKLPVGWNAGVPSTVFLDDQVVHSGHWAVRVERTADSPNPFSGINKVFPMDVKGTTIVLRGFIRTEDVSNYTALWMREDGDSAQGGSLAFATLQDKQIRGTTDWTEYSISVPVHAEAKQLFIGFFVAGSGKGWVDDLQLLVDGKPFWEAPKAEHVKTALDSDHEFDTGSKIAFTELTPVQIANLATLGKVWGFLKYHHPQVTTGHRHWDYDLFRIMPAVLAAPDRSAGNAALVKWIAELGETGQCMPCATLSETELHLRPDVGWIEGKEQLGSELSEKLRTVYKLRPANGKQFYVSLAPGVGNPVFANEPSYERIKLDAGFRLLALYRMWNIIEYWFPYRDLLSDDWNQVLVEFIPKVGLAQSTEDYQRALLMFFARIHDTHANLWNALQVRPPVGACQLPVIVRFIENRPVVSGYSDADAGPASGLKPGDTIEALDGVAASQLVERWKPYYAASNEPTVLRDMSRAFTRGDCGDAKVSVRRGGETQEVTAKRISGIKPNAPGIGTHDLAGPTIRRLSNDIAYLKLSSVKAEEAALYIDSAAGTKGLIIDIRNYPSEFMVFALGSLLVDKATPFTRFTSGDLSNPGAFHFNPPLQLNPGKAHYGGKVVILVDETSQSQAEYTTMAFRADPNAVVVGSTTAGADGNVSPIVLPGGLHPMMSGIGVFYPDKHPTQRVGILPDVEVRPTISGIGAGRDEVLEAAIRQILGADAPAAVVEKLAKPGQN
jgi:C-terminal processing protease CtpA/Prc